MRNVEQAEENHNIYRNLYVCMYVNILSPSDSAVQAICVNIILLNALSHHRVPEQHLFCTFQGKPERNEGAPDVELLIVENEEEKSCNVGANHGT